MEVVFRVRDQRRRKFGQEFQKQIKMFLLSEFTQSRFICILRKGASVSLGHVNFSLFLSTKVHSIFIKFMCVDMEVTLLAKARKPQV